MNTLHPLMAGELAREQARAVRRDVCHTRVIALLRRHTPVPARYASC